MATVTRILVEPGIYTRSTPNGRAALEISWRDARGAQRRKTVRGGITAARKALRAEHAARDRGERPAADPRLTLAHATELWWDARVVKLRPATQSAYQSGRTRLLDHFGRRRLSDISASDVARYVSAQQAAGFKGATIRGHLAVLSSVFRYASRHLGWVGINPVSLLDRVERPGTEDQKPKRILNADELERLLAAVPQRHRLVFQLAAETGVRLGEALGLVWGEVDTMEGALTLTHQLDRKGRRVPLKTTRSRRCIEITTDLAAQLRAARMAAERSSDFDLVFVSRDGTPHDHRNIAGRVLSAACTRAGLEAV